MKADAAGYDPAGDAPADGNRRQKRPDVYGIAVQLWLIALGGLVFLAAVVAGLYTSREVLLGVATAGALVTGYGWPHFLDVPARKTLAAVIAVPGIGSAWAAHTVSGPGYLDATPGFMALGFIAVFIVQLLRGTGQVKRLESTLGSCVGVLLSCLGAGWIAGARFNGFRDMLAVAAVSAAVAVLICLVRLPDRIIAPVGIAAAGLSGLLAGLVFPETAVLPAVVFGIVAGAVLVSYRRLATQYATALSVPAALSIGISPVLAAGSLAYFIDKLLIY